MRILLNTTTFHLTSEYLPCFIHGVEHSGSSFFSVAAVADLFLQGEKVLLFTAYPMARDMFLSLTTDRKDSGTIFTPEEIEKEKEKTAIIVKSGDEKLFLETLEKLPDISERIIFIKNIEHFSEELFEAVKDYKKIIFSGDLDRCKFKDKLLHMDFKTNILFSTMQSTNFALPELGQYEGLLLGENLGGIVVVK